MINFYTINQYCCEDISLIENYEQAINDKENTWVCHHRLETDLKLSKGELIARNMYYNRPACELIFLTHNEHASIHKRGEKNPMWGKPPSEETKKKISEANKKRFEDPKERQKISEKLTGIHRTEETKQKMSESQKGKNNPNYGRHRVYRDDGTYYMSF